MSTDHVSEDAEGVLKFSASAAENHQLCHRKGFLSRRTPKLQNAAFSFGTVTHGVAERYLSADDQGRVPYRHNEDGTGGEHSGGPLEGQVTGDTVDLYPESWASDLDRGAQSLIKRLIQMGIEEGVLERRPGRVIEGEFIHFLRDGAVRLRGFIDLQLPGEIQDHKTCKITKYAKGSEQLRTNLQMLIYAWWYFLRHSDEVEVIIRHNSFIKGWDYKKKEFFPKVRHRETTVTREYVLAWWDETIEPIIDEMLAIEPLVLEQWEEVQPAQRGSGACDKYGGCQFAGLCSGLDTLDEYLERIEKPMGIFDDIAAEAAIAEPSVGAAVAPEQTPKEKADAILTSAESGSLVAPPWAWDECPACGGAGFNKKGNPCKICDSRGGVTSDQYLITQDDLGVFSWADKPAAQSIPKIPDSPETRHAVSNPTDVTHSAVAKADSALLKKDIPTTVAAKPKGRPRKGFTLVINANVSRCQGTFVHADQLHRELAAGLASASGVESFFELHPFERRDALAAKAEKICSHFSPSTWVLANGTGLDFDHFVNNVLRPFAANVIERS